jgi:hypothetical protein
VSDAIAFPATKSIVADATISPIGRMALLNGPAIDLHQTSNISRLIDRIGRGHTRLVHP